MVRWGWNRYGPNEVNNEQVKTQVGVNSALTFLPSPNVGRSQVKLVHLKLTKHKAMKVMNIGMEISDLP